jgi:hypothetical protein
MQVATIKSTITLMAANLIKRICCVV